ncbi:MAG: hypothetical protein K2P81_06590 [Bacteriovoracaceae bacterium]|nr:hypothetical protein [Bacteriovoracaceae bacterium]
MTSNMLDQYQYLFVGGILGEFLSLPFVASYFKETEKLLKDQGANHVKIFFPHSFKTAEANVAELNSKIEKLWNTNNKPIILFCHSKGCIEAVLGLIENPALFSQSVQRVFCVQPPFKGATITEKRPGVKMSKVLNRAFRAGSLVWPGLRSLKKDAYTSHFENLAETRVDLRHLIEEKIVTVKAAKFEIDKVAWILKLSHQILWQGGDHTDGLLALRDQEMPGFKVKEVTIPMDHSDLFTSKQISNESYLFKANVLEQLMTLA